MANGSFTVVTVQMRFQLVKRDLVVVGKKSLDSGDTAGNITGSGVNLYPVAGGKDYRFGNFRQGNDFPERLLYPGCRESYIFSDFQGGCFVRKPHDNYIHR